MDPVFIPMILGLIGAVALVGLYVFIDWYFCLYVGIFATGVGVCWKKWEPIQRIFFILGLIVWMAVLVVVIIYWVLAIIALIHLVLSAIRYMQGGDFL